MTGAYSSDLYFGESRYDTSTRPPEPLCATCRQRPPYRIPPGVRNEHPEIGGLCFRCRCLAVYRQESARRHPRGSRPPVLPELVEA